MDDQRKARDDAMAAVEVHSAYWRPFAMKALHEAAVTRKELTSDDVWRILHRRKIPSPGEPRAMGPVMVAGQKEGWIVQTDRTKISNDPSTPNHSRPQRVYISRVVGKALPTWDAAPQIDTTAGAVSPGMAGREFPLGRNEDGSVEVKRSTCPECGATYVVRNEHLRSQAHRTWIAHSATLESVAPMPEQPQPQVYEAKPPKLAFGETVICPRCKGLRRRRKGILSAESMDPYQTGIVCIRCGGIGIVPNVSPIP